MNLNYLEEQGDTHGICERLTEDSGFFCQVRACRQFRCLAIAFVSDETALSYECAFTHLKSSIFQYERIAFTPEFLMGDASSCINGAMKARCELVSIVPIDFMRFALRQVPAAPVRAGILSYS